MEHLSLWECVQIGVLIVIAFMVLSSIVQALFGIDDVKAKLDRIITLLENHD